MRAGDVREPAARAACFLAADPRVLFVYLSGSAAQSDRETVRDVDLPDSLISLGQCKVPRPLVGQTTGSSRR